MNPNASLNIAYGLRKLQSIAPWILFSALIITLFAWFQFPALPSNDDALFLSRGVGHFSIIEFSPHFPGYAGLIFLVKLVRGVFSSDYQALHGLVLCMTSMIPVVSYLILRALKVEPILATAAAVSLYLQPLLISVALSGLSDGPGLFIWLLSLLFLLKGSGLIAAFLSGLMLTVRPSYLLLFIPVYGFLIKQHWHQFRFIMLAMLMPFLLAFIYMYAKDGLALFEEGLRFAYGHFMSWGNTSLTSIDRASWCEVISDYIGGQGVLIALCVVLLFGTCFLWFKVRPARCLIVSFVSMLIWTLLFQNPDNLRHLLPVVVLSTALVALIMGQVLRSFSVFSFVLLASSITALLLVIIQLEPRPPSIHQALHWLNMQPIEGVYGRVIITNEGVELAKEFQKKRRVADAWYKQQGTWLWLNGAWRLTFKPMAELGEPVKIFPRRFKGEHAIEVYRKLPINSGSKI